MKTYIIPQAKHRSGYYFRPHIGCRHLTRKVMFDKTSSYYFGDIDQYDINKLFGVSFGHHHTNSARFGWRSLSPHTTSIEILAYCYVDGVRKIEDDNAISICVVDIDKPYTYDLTINKTNYNFMVYNHFNTPIGDVTIPHNSLPNYGYYLYPYFGGNRKAIRDIKISME